jgi:hypothetical protein
MSRRIHYRPIRLLYALHSEHTRSFRRHRYIPRLLFAIPLLDHKLLQLILFAYKRLQSFRRISYLQPLHGLTHHLLLFETLPTTVQFLGCRFAFVNNFGDRLSLHLFPPFCREFSLVFQFVCTQLSLLECLGSLKPHLKLRLLDARYVILFLLANDLLMIQFGGGLFDFHDSSEEDFH